MRKVLLMLIALGLVGTAGLGVRAQTNGQPIAQYLEISPVRQELEIPPGTSRAVEVTITNKNVAPITLRSVFENIKADGDDGGTVAANEPVPWDLRQYTTVNTGQFVLGARESRRISLTVTIPPNAPPGGYYGRLRFTPTERTDLPPVVVTGEIAELFLVRVPGPAKEAGSLNEFNLVTDTGGKIGWFYFGNNPYYRTKVHNDGNVHFGTAPKVEARSFLGYATFNYQFDERNVFPQADRRFETQWNKPTTGIYTAKVKSDLPGQTGVERTIKFVVVTPQAILIFGVAVLLIAVLLVIRSSRKRRRSKVA